MIVERFFRVLCLTTLFVLMAISTSLACTLPTLSTNERPQSSDGPTEVTASFIVADLLGVDDVNQKLDIDLLGTFTWTDPRLTGLDGCRFNVTAVWFPPMILFNSSQLRAARTNAKNQVAIGRNGQVTYKQRYTGLISSYHNLRDFPFDRHDFLIRIGTLDFEYDELRFVASDENTWISDKLNIEGWDVEGIGLTSSNQFVRQSNQEVSVLSLVVSAARIPDYYAYRVLLLLAFVVAISWAIFWIPPSRFEFQMGLGATTMLTIMAFNMSIASHLPQLSYLTILDKILVWAIFLVFLSIVEALIAGLLVMNDQEALAVRLDKFSRVLFPLLLIVVWAGLIFPAL